MVRTYEITLGPKDCEHTRVEFDADQMIHAAWVYSEQLQGWVAVESFLQVAALAFSESVNRAMAEHLYQINNDLEVGA